MIIEYQLKKFISAHKEHEFDSLEEYEAGYWGDFGRIYLSSNARKAVSFYFNYIQFLDLENVDSEVAETMEYYNQ